MLEHDIAFTVQRRTQHSPQSQLALQAHVNFDTRFKRVPLSRLNPTPEITFEHLNGASRFKCRMSTKCSPPTSRPPSLTRPLRALNAHLQEATVAWLEVQRTFIEFAIPALTGNLTAKLIIQKYSPGCPAEHLRACCLRPGYRNHPRNVHKATTVFTTFVSDHTVNVESVEVDISSVIGQYRGLGMGLRIRVSDEGTFGESFTRGAGFDDGYVTGIPPRIEITELPNTSSGSGVVVAPPVTLPNGSVGSVTLTFDDVTAGGATTVTAAAAGPPPPSGFKLTNPPVYYDIQTTATSPAMSASASVGPKDRSRMRTL